MNNIKHHNVISFIKTIEGSHVFHQHRTFESVFSSLIEAFNHEITKIINDKTLRKKIGEYTQFAERLYQTENLILNNIKIEDIQDPDMRVICEYLNLLVERCNLSISSNKLNNSVLKEGTLRRKKRKLFEEINLFSKMLDEINSFDFISEQKLKTLNERYSRILSRLILVKSSLSEITHNTNNIINDKAISLSLETPKRFITKGLYHYESFLLEKDIIFKYNADNDFKNELYSIANKDANKNSINKKTEQKKNIVYSLFLFENDEDIYSF